MPASLLAIPFLPLASFVLTLLFGRRMGVRAHWLPIVTVLLVGGIMMLLGKRNPLQIACVSVATTFVVWLLFAKLLMLSMPMGILEDLI